MTSTHPELTGPRGNPITCLEDWAAHAGPKSANQWKPGRSAYELAAIWCQPAPRLPEVVRTLLDSHPTTRGATIVSGTPEAKIPFDDAAGEPRNADLALVATAEGGRLAITIEGKADESFGPLVGDAVCDAIDRSRRPRSRAVQRVEDLAASLLPPRGTSPSLPPLRKLRYQLLTAAAGTLAYARAENSQQAVLLIHEFVTNATTDERHAENARDLDLFVRRLTGGGTAAMPTGELIGPVIVPGAPLFAEPMPLLLAKVVTRLRNAGQRL